MQSNPKIPNGFSIYNCDITGWQGGPVVNANSIQQTGFHFILAAVKSVLHYNYFGCQSKIGASNINLHILTCLEMQLRLHNFQV